MSLFIFLDDDEWKKILFILNNQTVLSVNTVDNIIIKIKQQTGL